MQCCVASRLGPLTALLPILQLLYTSHSLFHNVRRALGSSIQMPHLELSIQQSFILSTLNSCKSLHQRLPTADASVTGIENNTNQRTSPQIFKRQFGNMSIQLNNSDKQGHNFPSHCLLTRFIPGINCFYGASLKFNQSDHWLSL